MSAHIQTIVDKAMLTCQQQGVKLTPKRQKVLEILLLANEPLSAYDVVDHYKRQFQDAIPVMSVYRMLNFLIDTKLVHKLETTNQFLPCAHISCDHDHPLPQFLICDGCHLVREVGIRKTVIQEIKDSVKTTGFVLNHHQLELHGLCLDCQTKKTTV